METNEICDVIAICISIVALIFAGICMLISRINVSVEYRKEILDWYGQCIAVIMKLKHCTLSDSEKTDFLSKLSGLIECGRFYFPNIQEKDGFGKNKSAAYKGYRSHVLEHLVNYYDFFYQQEENVETSADELEQKFTSAVYGYLKPWKFIRKLDFVLRESYKNDYSIEDEEEKDL